MAKQIRDYLRRSAQRVEEHKGAGDLERLEDEIRWHRSVTKAAAALRAGDLARFEASQRAPIGRSADTESDVECLRRIEKTLTAVDMMAMRAEANRMAEFYSGVLNPDLATLTSAGEASEGDDDFVSQAERARLIEKARAELPRLRRQAEDGLRRADEAAAEVPALRRQAEEAIEGLARKG